MKKLYSFILLFILISNPVFTANEENYRITGNHFYTALTLGLSIPSNPLLEIMGSGKNINICFGYNLNFDWFLLGIGAVIGYNFESTRSDVLYYYDMFSFPIALNLKFTTKFTFPICLFAELNGGGALNIINYTYLEVNKFIIKPFASASLGAGGYILPNVCIYQYISLMMIFFNNPIYIAFSPGFRVDVRF